MPPALLAFASGSGSRASGSPQLVFHTGRSRAVPGSDTPSVLSSYQGFVIQRCCGGSCISAQRQLQTGWARPWARPWALLWERTGLRPDVGRWEIRSIMRQVFRLVPPRSARHVSRQHDRCARRAILVRVKMVVCHVHSHTSHSCYSRRAVEAERSDGTNHSDSFTGLGKRGQNPTGTGKPRDCRVCSSLARPVCFCPGSPRCF